MGSLTAWLRTAWQVVPEGRGRGLVPLGKDDLTDDDAKARRTGPFG